MLFDRQLLDSKFVINSLRLAVFVYLILWGYWVLTGSGLVDRSGIQIGGDFSHYWVAASMARSGEAASVYDVSRFKGAQEKTFGAKVTLAWLYPPTYLLLLIPFSFLPYLVAFCAWISATMGGFVLVLRRLTPHPRMIWPLLVFPGTFLNFTYGQNGFLSGALLGGGLLLLDSLPVAGGILLGLLTFKPHLAALVPLALIAGRRWRALAAMLATAAALILASIIILGSEVWLAFLKNVLFSVQNLKTSAISAGSTLPLEKMAGVFTAVLLAGGNILTAAIFQGASMLLTVFLVAWAWRRGAPLPLGGSLLVLGAFLFTPYAFIYDLAILALPLAWLGWEGYARGRLPGEKTCLALGWLAPLLARPLAQATHLQIVPLILGLLFFLTLSRALRHFQAAPGTQR